MDCTAASRPTPAERDHEDAVQPVEYPEGPPEPLNEETATSYLESFERAYRRNHEITEKDQLTGFSVSVTGARRFDSPPGSAVVRLRTVYSGSFLQSESESTEGHVAFDSPNVFVSYYLDSSVVVRAEQGGGGNVDTDALDPDPWAWGEPVSCFE